MPSQFVNQMLSKHTHALHGQKSEAAENRMQCWGNILHSALLHLIAG